jgi:predicted metal-dependent hydrolase
MAVARSGNGTGPAPDRITDPAPSAVEVRRSGRRRRTVSAYREGGRTIVLIPARFTKAEERHWVDTMLGRLAAGDRRRRPDDAELSARARALSSRYLADAARPTSVRWVGNQMSRWGSCTPADGTIRISERLKGMPGYVLDYVLLHELAHLLRPAHDREFWRLLAAYPRVERARGYLEGVAAASGLGAWQDDWAYGEAGETLDLTGSDVGPVGVEAERATLF